MATFDIVDSDTGALRTASTDDIRGSSTDRVYSEILGQPSVARQLTAGATSTSTALTSTCKRVSIRARNADVRYVVGTGSLTASATASHFIAQDERLDIAVPLGASIAVIRDSAATSDATVCLTEFV